jgi:predicted nucleic acid-binding protein
VILYCDTSALVKCYVQEMDSDRTRAYLDSVPDIATSVVAFAEGTAAFNRKRREGGLPSRICRTVVEQFYRDYTTWFLIPVTEAVNRIVRRLLEQYAIRGFDALHLASALVLREKGNLDVGFACFDQRLNHAARQEGLVTPF